MTRALPRTHSDEGTDPLVAILKSPDFGAELGPEGQLPYRMDLLRDAGFRLGWTDRHLDSTLRPKLERLEQVTVPFTQALLSRRLRRTAAASLAMFESEGHGVALARRLSGRRRPPLVIVACWLTDLARAVSPSKRRLYRWLYGAVDAVVVFSHNQVDALVEELGLERRRIHVVRFGVDIDELVDRPTTDGDEVVAVGRDLGRDWATLASAAAGTGWRVRLATRQMQVAGIELPPEVTLLDRLDRPAYLDLLASAGVVVVPTRVLEYPTGQTVLLEAMALGKACVVTDTPAMREYVEDGRTALLVPPHDADALRAAVERLRGDDELRARIGAAARERELELGGARAMWAHVGRVLSGVADGTAARTGPGDRAPSAQL